MKKYTCEKCGWIQEQPDTYPQNVFQGAIEAHTNHFCKNKEKSYKQELEQMFDEKFSIICENMPIVSGDGKFYELDDIKQFIFETIIPEVLNSIIINNEGKLININAIVNIKQKAKELYGIDL